MLADVYRGRLKRGEDQIYSNWKSDWFSAFVTLSIKNCYRVECTNFEIEFMLTPWVDVIKS